MAHLDRAALERAYARLTQLSAIVESSDDAIIGKDLDGIVTSWNRGAERLYGYTAGEAIGRHIRFIAPPGLEGQIAEFVETIREGGRVEHVETLRTRKDGRCIHVSVTISPIYAEDKRVVGASAIARDITALKSAEQEIRTASRRREQFLAMLSHELRNPLAAVLNATKLIGLAPGDQSVIERARGVIERQSEHMARLLDDLLDVSRITRGSFELRLEDMDLRESIERALESIEPLSRSRQMIIERVGFDQPLPVRGDAARLQQVFVNLLSNACRYSPRGTVVRFTASDRDGVIRVRVEDEGRGISKELLPKIFELFVQTDQDLDRSDGGMGVGLSLVQKIVELHGGTVVAESDGDGRGSVFTVELSRMAGELRSTPRPVEVDGVRRRIVLVEDQDDAREMLRMLLEAKGHHVAEARNGDDGVRTIEREHPDVAFIDVGLPGMSGYEVARELRKNPTLEGVVLVALTGYGTEADIQKAHEAGFDRHIAKPAPIAEIDRVLRGTTYRD